MYELLKSYEGIGKRIFDVAELKQILGVDEKYSKYANFKSRILLKAQEDIEKHTDIRFTFEELSDYGRRVERIAFSIYKNKSTTETVEVASENAKLSSTSRETQIVGFGVSKATLETQVLANYETDYIVNTLKYCQNYFKHTVVKQKAGFFLKALQEGYFKDEIQKETKVKEKKIKIIEAQKVEDELNEKMSLEKMQKVLQLREEYLSDDFIEVVLEEHKGGFLYPIMEKSRRENKTLNVYLQGFVDKKLIEEF